MTRVTLDLAGSPEQVVRALKYVLKALLRGYGLRCRGVRIEESGDV